MLIGLEKHLGWDVESRRHGRWVAWRRGYPRCYCSVLEGDGTSPLRRPSNQETNSSEMESENNAQVFITPSRSELLNN